MSMKSEKESVVGLIERTHTDTIKIPLYKLKRVDEPVRSTSPPKGHSSAISVGGSRYDDDISVGGYSVNSYDSGLTFSSFQSKSCKDFTLRDKIKNLEDKIRKHQNRDDLPAVQLSPGLCAWDHRVPKKYRNRLRPPVNIIPCHQPSELIVARADERVRKQLTAKESREKHMSDLSQYIDRLIHLKLTRGERYAQQLENQKRQASLLKIVFACNYIQLVSPLIEASKKRHDDSSHIDNAARFLQRGMSMWYVDRVNVRFSNFEKVISKYKWRLEMVIRIGQKRRAARVLTTYLIQRKDRKGQMSAIIHQFLKGVRRLQTMARSFIECKIHRIRSLERIWGDLEKQFILCTMAAKRAESSHSSSASMDSLVIDVKTRIEMEKQNSRWDVTSKRFDRILEQHRARGDLDVSLEADGIDGMLIPALEKREHLETMLREKRKEHVLKLQDMQRQLNTSCQFSEQDAASFLKGDIEPGFRINLAENAHATIKVIYPFSVYRNLTDEDFLVRIKAIHLRRGTFEITPNNVHIFNAALQNEHKIQRNHMGEKIILRRSASVNIRAYEEHDSVLRGRLADAIAETQKDIDRRKRGGGLRAM